VVGQEHVVRTLSNAIEQDRVHHAYLFVGSRGTGKTSMAKILAASLNCQGASGGGHGPCRPTTTPCGLCESCKSIASASSLDVVEMDAASNNSVDDIRDLRERVGYAPVAGGYKVYILDEAHMLTPAAWNAFLKTLEEPPPHTIFVLATTEANKVLPTVVDRCHRFDFGRPSVVQIASVLRRVADSESIEIPDEAVSLVARSATGSFRDALGTLEQLLAYSDSESIVLDDVLAVLGAADADLLFGTLDAVAGGDARGALLAAARLAESGRDIGRFFGDLEAHARGLLVTQVLGEVPVEVRVTPDQDIRLAEQARRVGGAEIVRLLELIAFALRAMKDGADPRTQLELALVKAAKPDLEPSIKALQERIARLESRGPAPAAPAAARTPERAETPAGRAAAPAASPGAVAASSQAAAAQPAAPSPASASSQPAAPAHAAAPSAPPAASPAYGAAPSSPPAAPSHAVAPSSPPAAPSHAAAPSSSPAATPYGTAPPAHPASSPPPESAVPTRASDPRHGLTNVSITAEVDGQPPIAVSATLPGSGNGTAQEAQEAADDAAAAVARDLTTEGHPAPAVTAVATIDPEPRAPAPSLDLSFDTFSESWPAVIDSLRATQPMLAALLEDAAPASLTGDGLTLAWPESSGFLKRKAEDPANRDLIVKAIRSVTGTSLRLAYELRAAGEPARVGAAATTANAPISDEDLVQRFKDEFDAEELPPEPEEQT
jgi:DNA polymerase-3 subunit gamma/tau